MYDQSQNQNLLVNDDSYHPMTYEFSKNNNWVNQYVPPNHCHYQTTMNNATPEFETVNKLPKRPRHRTIYTLEQINTLQKEFSNARKISRKRRNELSISLNLTDKQLKTWFQNRRSKEKTQVSRNNFEGGENLSQYTTVSPIEADTVIDLDFKSSTHSYSSSMSDFNNYLNSQSDVNSINNRYVGPMPTYYKNQVNANPPKSESYRSVPISFEMSKCNKVD